MSALPIIADQTRESVLALQAEMLQFPQVELPTFHWFADGMYARVVERPAGALIVGKIHKKPHFYIVTKGRVQIGKDIFEAGTVIVSQPGTKRAVYALEDSICMTIHRTDKTDLAEIEAELVEQDESSPFGVGNKLKAIEHKEVA